MAHKTDTTLTGAAGEHLVLSRLLQRGIVAAQAPEGLRNVDILVTLTDPPTSIVLQVKSRQRGADGGWHMSVKHETVFDAGLFYCFVDFAAEHPTVHVIPARVVAKALREDHEIWLATPGKNGKPHSDTAMRRLRPSMFSMPDGWMNQYFEAWGQLTQIS